MHRLALGVVPYKTGNDPDLVIKASATGITFLGYYDEELKQYVSLRKFKSRYTGSKACAVGINAEIWPRKSDYVKMQSSGLPSRLFTTVDQNGLNYLDHERYKKETAPKGRGKKKAGSPACLIKLSNCSEEQQASSAENSESGNFAPTIAKKVRKKAYTVNKREVRQRILGYINTQKGKKHLYFWTVSFPEGTPDAVVYQIFNIWLTMLRKRYPRADGTGFYPPMLKEYLWVAERQDGKRIKEPGRLPTNTLHFHIAIPHFMDVHRANAMMRGTLKTFAKRGLMPGAAIDCKTKKVVYLNSIANYNGVDICKHKKTNRPINFAIKKGSRALAGYLTKYVTKNNAGIPDETGEITVPAFDHLAWHNSRGFSALFTGVTFTLTEFRKSGLAHFLNRVRVFKMNFAIFVPWLYGPPPKLEDHLYELNSYIQTIQDDGKQKNLRAAGSSRTHGTGQAK